jgi:hypothetical protein
VVQYNIRLEHVRVGSSLRAAAAHCWTLLAASCWLLAAVGDCWELLGVSGCYLLVVVGGCCWPVLTVVDCCLLLLFAHLLKILFQIYFCAATRFTVLS